MGDFEVVRGPRLPPRAATSSEEGKGEIVVGYVGAGGAIMRRGWQLVCDALAALQQQGNERVARLHIRLLGTTYAWKPGDPQPLQAIADRAGIGAFVEERPERVTFRQSLETLLAADGALVLGVDDADYMPSKLFSYALSGKPLLAVLRRESPAYRCMAENPGMGFAIWFGETTCMPMDEAVTAVRSFLDSASEGCSYDRVAMLSPFLSNEMARRHVEVFDSCLAGALS